MIVVEYNSITPGMLRAQASKHMHMRSRPNLAQQHKLPDCQPLQ